MASDMKLLPVDGTGNLTDEMADDMSINDPDFDPTSLGFATRAEFDAFIQEGIDDIEAGRMIPHEVVMAEMRATIAKYR